MLGWKKLFAYTALLAAVVMAYPARSTELSGDIIQVEATTNIKRDLSKIKELLRHAGVLPDEASAVTLRDDIVQTVLATRRLGPASQGVVFDSSPDLLRAMGWLSVHVARSQFKELMHLAPKIRFEALNLLNGDLDRSEPAEFVESLDFLAQVGAPHPLHSPTLDSFARNRPFAIKAAFLAADRARSEAAKGQLTDSLAHMVGKGVWQIRSLAGPRDAKRFYLSVMPILNELTRGMSDDRTDMYWQGIVHLLRLGLVQEATSWYTTVAAHTLEKRRATLEHSYASLLIQENLHAWAAGDPALGVAALALARRMIAGNPFLARQIAFAEALTASCADLNEVQALRRLDDTRWRATLDAGVPDNPERRAFQFHEQYAVARIFELRGNRDKALELYTLLSADLIHFLSDEDVQNIEGALASVTASGPLAEELEKRTKYSEALVSLPALRARIAFRRALLGEHQSNMPTYVEHDRMALATRRGAEKGEDRSALWLQMVLARQWVDQNAPEHAESLLLSMRDRAVAASKTETDSIETPDEYLFHRLLDEELAAALLAQGRIEEGLAVLDRSEDRLAFGVGVTLDHMIPQAFGPLAPPIPTHAFPELDEIGLGRSLGEDRFRRLQLAIRALQSTGFKAAPEKIDSTFRALQHLVATPTSQMLVQAGLRRHYPDPKTTNALDALTRTTHALLRAQQFFFDMPWLRPGAIPHPSDTPVAPAYAVPPCSPEAIFHPYAINFPKAPDSLLESATDLQDHAPNLLELTRDFELALDKLKQIDPTVAAIAVESSAPLAKLREVLRPNEGVLIVHSSEIGLVAGLATTTNFHFHERGTRRGEITALVRALRSNIVSDNRDFPVDVARQLYDLAIGPFATALDGLKRINLVLSGPLDALPPWLLVAAEPPSRDSNSPLTGVVWFADRHPLEIAIVPSITQFVLQRSRTGMDRLSDPRFGSFKHFLGFGDPLLEGEPPDCQAVYLRAPDPRIDAPPNVHNWAALRSLCSLKEAGDILRLLYVRATGDDISDSKALANLLVENNRFTLGQISALEQSGSFAKADLIVFATHGLQADEVRAVGGSLQPALLLSPPSATDAGGIDGLLNSERIASLDLANRPWVVLSACNTARPDGAPGSDSLSGLSRAFLLAGARGVLGSHWSVYERQTVELLDRIGSLSREEDLPIERALLRAQKSMRAEPRWMHPRNWAAFVAVVDQ